MRELYVRPLPLWQYILTYVHGPSSHAMGGACTSCRATADESVIMDPAAQVVQQAAEEGLALIPSLSDVSQFQNVGKCKFSDHFTATVKRDGKTVSLGTYTVKRPRRRPLPTPNLPRGGPLQPSATR